ERSRADRPGRSRHPAAGVSGPAPLMNRRLLVLAAALVAASCGSDTGNGAGSVRVVIPRGAALGAVADSLVADSAITSPGWFRFLARVRGKVHGIRAGSYDLPKGGSAWRALTVVTSGSEALDRVVVLEGLTLNEVAAAIHDQLGIPVDSVLAAAHAPALATQVGIAAPSPRRRDRHIRLQAAPTVSYALGKRRRLWEKDYLTPSRYNTYLIDGLPPGPIGEPAEASIEAALYPVPTAFLYFVARGDGKHI